MFSGVLTINFFLFQTKMAMFSGHHLHLLPLFLLLLLPNSSLSQSNGNMTVGNSLTATENSSPLLSPSGEFAFGFSQLGNQDLFLLSIWYAKIPNKTIVWYANGDPPQVPKGSKVNLTADRGLVLTNPQGEELWTSESISGEASHGFMSNEGNFIIEDSSSENLWDTFSKPTDTMLPTQTMDRGGVLSSRQTETNFSKGRFQLRLQQDGNLVLNTINLPTDFANSPYYKSGTTGGNETANLGAAGKQIVFNESGYLYVLRENGERFNLTQGNMVSSRDYYFRATLSFDGVFTQYFHPKSFTTSNGSWTSLWSIPNNICVSTVVLAGLGACGDNSICRLKKDKRPKCECIQGYSLTDPDDIYGNCKPDFIQGCKEDELSSGKDLYDVMELMNAGWPQENYMALTPSTRESCKESCLEDCLCAIAVLREGTCWKKRLPVSNGRIDSSLPSVAFIKIRKDNSTTLSQYPVSKVIKKNQNSLIRLTSGLFGASVCINFMLFGAICIGFFFIYKRKHERSPSPQEFPELNLRCFTFKELEEATDGFKEELGRGAFGIVYKGHLIQTNSNTAVAVKKLSSMLKDGEREFKAELKSIGQIHHKNLVRLLGYCDDGQNRLLVYEFLRNGTLASFLFGDLKPTWNQRCEIAFGIAKALLYLHEECSTQIIHCDIKPQNILLDEYNIAKVSDFGLAKLLMMNQSRTKTDIRGTKGYVAPEWFRNMPITSKVDVYSFGVVLLEIICCRRNVDMEITEEGREILTDWAYDCFREGSIDVLVDSEVEALVDRKRLEMYVMVSMWCIQENPSIRPNMRKVVQMLEGVVEVHVPPCPSPF